MKFEFSIPEGAKIEGVRIDANGMYGTWRAYSWFHGEQVRYPESDPTIIDGEWYETPQPPLLLTEGKRDE